ncbi:MAG: hypothetical protein ACP5G0_01225 [Desulfomonilia bacterium]
MTSTQSKKIDPGILTEVLRTPVCKDQLRSCLKMATSSSGSSLVRSIMWQDPEVFLSLVSALPSLVNTLVDACAEMGEQLKEKFPPELLSHFILSIASEIDTERLKACSHTWSELLGGLWTSSTVQRESMRASITKTGPVSLSQGINSMARVINALETAEPGIVRTFLSDLLAGLDRHEIGTATHTLADGLLDQKWKFGSWVLELVRRRIRRRFGKETHHVDIRRWECS